MFKNYFKIAWRNLVKSKVFSFINIFGLTIGLVCCMLISLYIQHELSYDTYHANKDRIYQIVGESIGAKKTVLERALIKDGNGGGDKNDERLPWLEQTIYEGLINKLQLPITNQVNVKLSIVEVTREFTDNIGVDWNTYLASRIMLRHHFEEMDPADEVFGFQR